MVVAWKCLKIVAWLQWPGSIPYWRHNVHSRSSASHLSWVSWQSRGSGCKDQTLPSSSQTPFISAHWTEFRIHTEWKCQIMANHTENVPVANTEQENNTEEGARHPGDTSPGDINKNDYESMIQKKNIAKVNAVKIHIITNPKWYFILTGAYLLRGCRLHDRCLHWRTTAGAVDREVHASTKPSLGRHYHSGE